MGESAPPGVPPQMRMVAAGQSSGSGLPSTLEMSFTFHGRLRSGTGCRHV